MGYDPAYVFDAPLSALRCVCCGQAGHITVDHIVPEALGGGSHRENLQPLCWRCNQTKAELENQLLSEFRRKGQRNLQHYIELVVAGWRTHCDKKAHGIARNFCGCAVCSRHAAKKQHRPRRKKRR